jgi:hypothetical protein
MLTFPSLAKYLERFGFEEYLDEIALNILKVRSGDENDASSNPQIKTWSVKEVAQWIQGMSFFGQDALHIATVMEEQEVDGFTFLQLDESQWIKTLQLDAKYYLLIECIRSGWMDGWGDPVQVPPGMTSAVFTGLAADLSACDASTAKALVEADHQCMENGTGMFYGQLTVLGYKEYHAQDSSWQPVGPSNEKFVLTRKKIPNGVKRKPSRVLATEDTTAAVLGKTHRITVKLPVDVKAQLSAPSSSIAIEFIPDPAKDCFQIGRMAEPNNGE